MGFGKRFPVKLRFAGALLSAIAVLASVLAACSGSTEATATAAPVEIVSHDDGLGYAGFGWICHGPGTGDLEMPFEGLDDHTDHTEEQCMSPDCHVVGKQK